ncbi:MAG: serine hydrolase [Gemmatimonadota bacterium]
MSRSILAGMLLVLAGCSGSSSAGRPAVDAAIYPDPEWQTIARPEDAGWSSAGLQKLRDKLSTLSTTGMMAVVGGRVIFQYGDVQRVSYLASVRKSVLSMLYGIYQDRGKINLDLTLEQLGIDDIGGLTKEERQARVRDLIRARSGVYHAASNSGDDLASAPPRGSQKPGAYYLYSNWDFNALGAIFTKQTGMNIYDALEQDLVRPLGFQDFNRATHRLSGDSTLSKYLAYHMNFSTRDMARIGYVMLREGVWKGRQIVPRAWVRESTALHTPRAEMNPARNRNGAFGYGYLWWIFDNPTLPAVYQGAYTGLGAVGQHILVMPKLDLVVAHKTQPGNSRSVSHAQFLEIMTLLVASHCGQQC